MSNDWMVVIDEIEQHLGPAKVAVPKPQRLGDFNRQCWVWFPGDVNHYLNVDQYRNARDGYGVRAGNHHGVVARLKTADPPTAHQVRQVAALAGLLPTITALTFGGVDLMPYVSGISGDRGDR